MDIAAIRPQSQRGSAASSFFGGGASWPRPASNPLNACAPAQLLCRLLNSIKPNCIEEYHDSRVAPGSVNAVENLRQVSHAMTLLGVPASSAEQVLSLGSTLPGIEAPYFALFQLVLLAHRRGVYTPRTLLQAAQDFEQSACSLPARVGLRGRRTVAHELRCTHRAPYPVAVARGMDPVTTGHAGAANGSPAAPQPQPEAVQHASELGAFGLEEEGDEQEFRGEDLVAVDANATSEEVEAWLSERALGAPGGAQRDSGAWAGSQSGVGEAALGAEEEEMYEEDFDEDEDGDEAAGSKAKLEEVSGDEDWELVDKGPAFSAAHGPETLATATAASPLAGGDTDADGAPPRAAQADAEDTGLPLGLRMHGAAGPGIAAAAVAPWAATDDGGNEVAAAAAAAAAVTEAERRVRHSGCIASRGPWLPPWRACDSTHCRGEGGRV